MKEGRRKEEGRKEEGGGRKENGGGSGRAQSGGGGPSPGHGPSSRGQSCMARRVKFMFHYKSPFFWFHLLSKTHNLK